MLLNRCTNAQGQVWTTHNKAGRCSGQLNRDLRVHKVCHRDPYTDRRKQRTAVAEISCSIQVYETPDRCGTDQGEQMCYQLFEKCSDAISLVFWVSYLQHIDETIGT